MPNKSLEIKQILYAFFFPAIFVLVLWLVWMVEKGFDMNWYRFGIIPRTVEGLRGILFSPFIHSDANHLYSNSVPILVLCWCLFYFYKDSGYLVFPFLWILSGIFTWLMGRESFHIGASGLIYSLSLFLFFSGILRKYIPLMAVSLIVVFLYGSTVWSMFPVTEIVDPAISWEAHLAGAFSGIICAFVFRHWGPKAPEPEEEEEPEEEDEPEEEEEMSEDENG
ncbi:MAG: rhomboid family intramembrane serine protease [Dysgonamonadaceae bacterium]|jgi:membrane associated rhomboid family serine protease|nr:rhomboid family intramembrane serine protease [Dysgonamonadaceae bacterium]